MIEIQIDSRVWVTEHVTHHIWCGMVEEYKVWWRENIPVADWTVSGNEKYTFVHEADAIAFKLKFGL
jgi:hypothetical protein